MSAPARFVTRGRYGGSGGRLRVGGSTFMIPGDSEVRHVGMIAYVRDPNRPSEVHAFIDGGEVEVPKELSQLLAAKYFDRQEDSEPEASGASLLAQRRLKQEQDS